MKNKKVIIMISILVLILIGIIFIFLFSKNKLVSNKRVEGLVITDSNIIFDDELSISFLSANVKNSSKEDKKNVKLKVIFLDKKKREITNIIGFLGDIDTKQTRELNVAISRELKDVVDIKYEISK